ncbi:MAG: M6 family metalloprotease domain-containing protein [Anaerolineaceae bacterium]|nr:M6 family metalloprotease domain-containing protein [Anaerolineaceae bacterium]
MFKNRIFFSALSISLALVCALLFTARVEASPAAPVAFELPQPDGSTVFTARQWGDEYNNGVETVEGYSILQLEDGWWAYAELREDGLLAPALGGEAPRLVGIDAPDGLKLHLRSQVMNENPHSPAAMDLAMPSLESTDAPTLTTLKTLVLLADFNNVTPTYTPASFQSLMFSTTASSVRKYYREASFNNLDIVPAEETCGTSNDGITNWTELGYDHPNTGDSTGTANYDIVKNVLTANNGCINFASFDTNSNGYIETSELVIVVVVGGYERAYTPSTPNIWAHQGWLNSATGGAPTLDGKTLGYYPYGNYAQFGERHGTHQATIGIMAHEYGHIIDWPDEYDIDQSSEGVGEWSIMGGGSWNGITYAGDSPALPDAFLKWYQGWITPTSVSGTLNNAAIPQASSNPTAFLLRPNPGGVDWNFLNKSGTGEYFLVENRQNNAGAGYDDGLPGCGLMIWHIDESVTSTNSANANENHALVWLEQADGLNELAGTGDRGDTGDPWVGNKTFDYSSNPNSRLYNKTDSQVSVHVDSTSCASTMYADLVYPAPLHANLFLPLIKRPLPATTGGPILNGNFELGPVNWTSFNTAGWPVIRNTFGATGLTPHSGSWATWLGGEYSNTNYIEQTVTVGSLNPYLVYYYVSASNDYCGYDFGYIRINGSSVYTRELCTTTNTSSWVRASLDLSSYSGQTVTLQFRVYADSSFNSNWFIDDVSFSATATAPPFEVEGIFPFDSNITLTHEEMQ